jgi:hypothetical protein
MKGLLIFGLMIGVAVVFVAVYKAWAVEWNYKNVNTESSEQKSKNKLFGLIECNTGDKKPEK